MSHFKISTQYSAKYLDPRWQKKRLTVLSRDNFTCQVCGAEDKPFHVHHLHYWEEAEGPWDYGDESLLTVCTECHASEHDGWKSKFAYLVRSAAVAGFRTNDEVTVLSDLLVSMGEAAAYPEKEDRFIEMIKAQIAKTRARCAK